MSNPERVVNFVATEETPLASWEADEAERRREQAAKLLTSGQLHHLTLGKVYSGETGFSDLESLKAAWSKHRESLMARWASRHGNRPAAWWMVEFPWSEVYSQSVDPLHFGKFVPAMEDQEDILARHDMLSDAELEVQGRMAGTI